MDLDADKEKSKIEDVGISKRKRAHLKRKVDSMPQEI